MNGVWTCDHWQLTPEQRQHLPETGSGLSEWLQPPIGEFFKCRPPDDVDILGARFDELGITKDGWFSASCEERANFYLGKFIIVCLDSNPGKYWIGPARELLEH